MLNLKILTITDNKIYNKMFTMNIFILISLKSFPKNFIISPQNNCSVMVIFNELFFVYLWPT